MKNALNYVTYGICSAAVLSASFIGFAVFSGTPVQDLKGVGSLFADDVEVELEGETDGGEVASRAERSADTRSTRQVFDEAGLALGSFTLPSPFSVEELNSLEAQLKTKLDELAEAGVFGGHTNFGAAGRYWDFRSVGRGSVDFEEIIRRLNRLEYRGPLSVEWEDSGMDREHGAAESAAFLKRLDFEPAGRAFDSAFSEE